MVEEVAVEVAVEEAAEVVPKAEKTEEATNNSDWTTMKHSHHFLEQHKIKSTLNNELEKDFYQYK